MLFNFSIMDEDNLKTHRSLFFTTEYTVFANTFVLEH